MKKIAIIGAFGSGKSMVALRVADILKTILLVCVGLLLQHTMNLQGYVMLMHLSILRLRMGAYKSAP